MFNRLGLKEQLTGCFRHLKVSPIFGHGLTVLLLIVHLLLGYRRLQDMRYYKDDPMVRRLLGIARLPDVATVSRTLAGMDSRSVDKLRRLNRQQVLQRLDDLGLARITLDFDGSVFATGRFAEGTAVGFNRKKKGNAATIRCSAHWRRPAKYSMFGIVPVMCMTQRRPGIHPGMCPGNTRCSAQGQN
ncbi:MAG: transposase [Chromatiaceae bacterium]|nr:transposase [Chromatiaceae bacterium]